LPVKVLGKTFVLLSKDSLCYVQRAIVAYNVGFTGLPQHTDSRDSPISTLCTASTVCRGPVYRAKTDTGSVLRVLRDRYSVVWKTILYGVGSVWSPSTLRTYIF